MFISCELGSQSLATYQGINILIPDGQPPENGWRTLYLLHGLSDDYTMWMRRSSVERYAEERNIAVIMPGVQVSSYSDMSHGGKFYTYVTKELPMVLEDMFCLSRRREDRAVAGLSMGGEGAMKIGISCPELFSSIGCFSAGAFNHPWVSEPSPETEPYTFLRHEGKKLTGSPEDVFENAKAILRDGKPIPRIYHTIGKSDFLLESAHETRDFFTSLPGNPFEYVYNEDEGAHTWSYWDSHLPIFMDFAFDNR